MASQVQIPFEGVILQEHSAPISCPTPNFAKGSGDLFWEALHRDSDMKWKQTTRGIWWYSRSAHKFVVAVPHPEARVQDSLLLYALLDAIKEIKENQDHDRPGNSR